jgi:hypothetical protein
MKQVFVMKTSVTTPSEVSHLKPLLDRLMHQGDRWNFDLDDCDKILRVESAAPNAVHVMRVLKVAGYACEELQ